MTDASVVSIFDLARQARLSNVGIICTKSDVSCDNYGIEGKPLETDYLLFRISKRRKLEETGVGREQEESNDSWMS